MKKSVWSVGLLAAVMLGLIAGSAQAWWPGKKRLQHADQNKDGVIQPAEVKAEKKWEQKQAVVDKVWEQKADLNHDGKLDRVELRAYYKKIVDQNGDGQITVEERKTFWLTRRAKVNTPVEQRFDADNNGWIEGDEAKAMMTALVEVIKTSGKAKVNTDIEKQFDVNNDGLIDESEAEGVREALGI